MAEAYGLRRLRSSQLRDLELTDAAAVDTDSGGGSDSDYSSDNSLLSIPAGVAGRAGTAAPADNAGRQNDMGSPRRHRSAAAGGRQATAEDSERVFNSREALLGQPYRFTDAHQRGTPHGKETMGVASTDGETVEMPHLRDLVNADASSWISSAWGLLALSEKTKRYPPFSVLPQCPNILEVRVGDTEAVSRFMNEATVDLASRVEPLSMVKLQALIVRNAVDAEALRLGQGTGTQQPLPDSFLDPLWESDRPDELAVDCDAVAEGGDGTISPMDFGIAMGISSFASEPMPLQTLVVFHQLANRCLATSSAAVLGGWGLQRVNGMLIKQVDRLLGAATRTTAETAWLQSAIGLAFKLAAGSSCTDQLLSLLRSVVVHKELVAQLNCAGALPLVEAVEMAEIGRMRLQLPSASTKGQSITLFGDAEKRPFQFVASYCIVGTEPEMKIVALTDTGLFRVALQSPFAVEASNAEYTSSTAHHLVLAPSGRTCSCVVSDSGGAARAVVLDTNTLELQMELPLARSATSHTSPALGPAPAGDATFSVHMGNGRLVEPFYACSNFGCDHCPWGSTATERAAGATQAVRRTAVRYATFIPGGGSALVRGEVHSETCEPLPRSSESLSVQFYLRECPTTVTTRLHVLTITMGRSGRVWLDVEVVLQPATETMRIVFTHGKDAVAEVEQPWLTAVGDVSHQVGGRTSPAAIAAAPWRLWSATMTSVNDVATWSVYCDGVLCEARSRSGPLTRPDHETPVFQLLNGNFSGQIALIQAWSRARNASDMRAAATEGTGPLTGHLIANYRLDEGVGCYLQCSEKRQYWQGTGLTWAAAPYPLPVKPMPSAACVKAWRPRSRGESRIISNGFETAILQDDGLVTWMNDSGQIIEQRVVPSVAVDSASPALLFYCPSNNKFYTLHAQEGFNLRVQPLPGLASQQVSSFASVTTARSFFKATMGKLTTSVPTASAAGERASTIGKLTILDVAEYILRKMNQRAISEGTAESAAAAVQQQPSSAPNPAATALSLCDTLSPSMRTIGRLLAIVEDVSQRLPAAVSGGETPIQFELLLLAVCGRLLARQVRLVERRCPARVVTVIVETYKMLQVHGIAFAQQETATASYQPGDDVTIGQYWAEARVVFDQLNKLALAECVSHDYQLKLISESTSLSDVKHLLASEMLQPFVTSVIAKDLKKPFMMFLNRLKDQCQVEAECVFNDSAPEFDAAEALLLVLLGMLTQRDSRQWHLVAVALVGTLTKAILRSFQAKYPTAAEQRSHMSQLKRTAIGVAVYPVMHYLYDFEFHHEIASRAVKALHDTHNALSVLASAQASAQEEDDENWRETTVTEVYTLTTPQDLRGSFTVALPLHYASSIAVQIDHIFQTGPIGSPVGSPTSEAQPAARGRDDAVPVRMNICVVDSKGEWSGASLNESCISDVSLSLPGGNFNIDYGRVVSAEGLNASNSALQPEEEASHMAVPVISITVTASVPVRYESVGWVRGLCFAFADVVVRAAHNNLLSTLPSSRLEVLEPFLRGGLSTAQKMTDDVSRSRAQAAGAATNADDEMDEEGRWIHERLCAIVEGDGTKATDASGAADAPPDAAALWQRLFQSKRFPFPARLETILRWSSCVLVWHRLQPTQANAGGGVGSGGVSSGGDPSSAGPTIAGGDAPLWTQLEEELSHELDWLKRKAFLLLEAGQQGRTNDIVARARFLLYDMNPRCRAEAKLAEAQVTEEPIAAGQDGHLSRRARPSRTGAPNSTAAGGGSAYPFNRVSRHSTLSRQRLGGGGASTMGVMLMSNRFGVSRHPTRGAGSGAAVKLFSSSLKQESESLQSQIFEFLVNTSGARDRSTEEIASQLRVRAAHADAFTETCRLQEALCTSYARRPQLVASVLLSHLSYRQRVAAMAPKLAPTTTPRGAAGGSNHSTPTGEQLQPLKASVGGGAAAGGGYSSHYCEHMLGCGIKREFGLHKAACGFVQTALRTVLKRMPGRADAGKTQMANDVSSAELLAMCAVLCHPWDGTDMMFLHPDEVFTFLRRLMSASLTRRLEWELCDDGEKRYEESKGIFDLFHRCLIVPNALLQVSVEGVRVVDGEAQGLHVENAHVVCSARNHWKPLNGSSKMRPRKGAESDLFANYGLPCVVSELPDVLYFEVTVDLSMRSAPAVTVGVSSMALSPVENITKNDGVFCFSSDGIMNDKYTSLKSLSEAWQVGDVIGCGIMAPENRVFFTRNGTYLGASVPCEFQTIVPFVSVRCPDSLIKLIVNFGTDMPFKFNIAALHISCRRKFLTQSTLCDAAFTTAHYLIAQCYHNLSTVDETAILAPQRDAVSSLLERAASFLNTTLLELVDMYRKAATSRRTEDTQSQGDPAKPRPGKAAAGSPSGSGSLQSPATTALDQGEGNISGDVIEEPLAVMITRLFRCLSLVIECFAFDSVTQKTHTKVLEACALALTSSHDKWVKVRAAECLGRIPQVMRADLLAEATESFKRIIPAEEIVHHLVGLARSRFAKDLEPPPPPPKWVGGMTVVRGRGIFYGALPLPKSGTHMVGFRIRRRHQMGQGVGAPLGGCYYLGLSHGQPQITNMNSLIARTDMFVMQDTDDHDQVPHLLLMRQSIPRNSHRRIFGNDEIVWVQFNADQGEITFYREGMALIGLAFANIKKTDDLYPVVYHFNEDASCEILPPPASNDESIEEMAEKLRRSVAVHTLQNLHVVDYFADVVSQFIQRAVIQLDRGPENCLVALSILGGDRSYVFCQHEVYGLVIVYAIAEVARKAVVFLANDEDRHLFCVPPQSLKPSFIQTPLYASGNPDAEACASLLMGELSRSLYDASVVAPLLREERECREAIVDEYVRSINTATTVDLVGLIGLSIHPGETARMMEAPPLHGHTPHGDAGAQQRRRGSAASPPATADNSDAPSRKATGGAPAFPEAARLGTLQRTLPSYLSSNSSSPTVPAPGDATQEDQPGQQSPQQPLPTAAQQSPSPAPHDVTVRESDMSVVGECQAVALDRRRSTKSVYSPNPSVGVSSGGPGCATMRANAIFESRWSLAIAITEQRVALPTIMSHTSNSTTDRGQGQVIGTDQDDLIYVGLTTSTDALAGSLDEVRDWEDAWTLCSVDSIRTNSVNCSVEPGMIFSGDRLLFVSGDLLVMDVDRAEGTVAFSRVRKGKKVSFGVLFEGVPSAGLLRPLVVCGPDTVVVFSFLGGEMFPARNTFPSGHFSTPAREPSACSVCEAPLTCPWYGGENEVSLCQFCFRSWQHPKELFYVTRDLSPPISVPRCLISSNAVHTLVKGSVVEFSENAVPEWSPAKSVNVESVEPTTVISVFEEAFAVSEPLSLYGSARVDVQVGHIAGVAGCPFSGLLPFVPLWRDEQQTRTQCVVQSESLVISASVIPAATKTLFSIRITEAQPNQSVSLAGVFVGVTNMSDTAYTVTRADLDRLCSNNNVWGSWCDSKDKVSATGTVYVLVNTMQGIVMISSSLDGLHRAPFIVTCSVSLDSETNENLRLVLFSHETCRVTSSEGLTSCADLAEPSFAPVAIGLVPDDTFGAPARQVFEDAIVLSDTIAQTALLAEAANTSQTMHFTRHAVDSCEGVLFNIDDTVTVIVKYDDDLSSDSMEVAMDSTGGPTTLGATTADEVAVPETVRGEAERRATGGKALMFVQGVLVAERSLTPAEARRRYRVAVYLSAHGLTASFVAAPYGRTRLGRVTALHGPEVCVVSAIGDRDTPPLRVVARRKDLRCCLLAASALPSVNGMLEEGTPVVYCPTPLLPPKRSTIVSYSGSVITVADSTSERTMTHLSPDQCFLLDMEGTEPAYQPAYPLITPPTSTITKLFEVGKNKYRLQSKGSYNGIMFDCKVKDTVELLGISVLSHTSGRHRADVFFKKGSHRGHERDQRCWTSIFSGFVDMHAERQFPIPFNSISIDAGSTFAIYINTSHNCGVGFFCEEDGCQGEVGGELDADGTVTVMLGRKSGSSTAFGDFSLTPRGFCGTLIYKQGNDSKAPRVEGYDGSQGGNRTSSGSAGSPSDPAARAPRLDASSPGRRSGQALTAAAAAASTNRHTFSGAEEHVCKLVSRPTTTSAEPWVSFTVEVPETAVRIQSMRLAIIIESWDESTARLIQWPTPDGEEMQAMPSCFGLLHCVVSVLFYPLATGPERLFSKQTRQALGDYETDAIASPMISVHAPGEPAKWNWAWNSRVLVDSTATEVEVKGLDIRLGPGRYRFMAVVRDLLGEHSDDCSLRVVRARDARYTKTSPLVNVKGFFGDMVVEPDAPTLAGELHTMTTGTFLNQSNSASYNGIMFDMRSKQDVNLEEVFCISQTSAEHVTVRLFWKEGSMEGAVKSPMQWKEIASKEMQLVDKQPFSVGPLSLRMRANQMYSLFINTTSSCGVRFYNSSDGHVGDIGDEFESDGILTIYVGRKSESSSPFAEIPMEPRAFRGKLIYRTFASPHAELVNNAMFSYFRAFVVTRMLVALSSYVDCSASTPANASRSLRTLSQAPWIAAAGKFSYEVLLSVVSTLATSPCVSIDDLIGAENLLTAVLKDSPPSELRDGVVTVPLAPDRLSNTLPVCVGDFVICVENHPKRLGAGAKADTSDESEAPPAYTNAVGTVVEIFEQDETATVVFGKGPAATEQLCLLHDLLPLVKCQNCQRPYAMAAVCAATGMPHEPPADEEDRMLVLVANAVHNRSPIVDVPSAHAMAKVLVGNPKKSVEEVMRCKSHSPEAAPDVAPISLRVTVANAAPRDSVPATKPLSSFALFVVPVEMLLPEQDSFDHGGFMCQLVFNDDIQAYVSLRIHPSPQGITVDFVTDRPLRQAAVEAEAYSVQLFALQDPDFLGGAIPPRMTSLAVDDSGAEFVTRTEAVPLLPTSFTYIACRNGRLMEPLISTPLPAATCSFLSKDGMLHFLLSAQQRPLPSCTRALELPRNVWSWEDGRVEAKLSSAAPMFLRGPFTPAGWPAGKPRFCSLMVVPKGKDKTVFLEVHVVFDVRRGPGLWDSTPRTTTKTLVRKPLSLMSGEVVTLGFSTDGDFFVCDAEDVVRCSITAAELSPIPHHPKETVTQKLGFVSVDQEAVSAVLAVLEHGRRTTRPLYSPEIRSHTSQGDDYDPTWQIFDTLRVNLSRTCLVASCCSDIGGQAVLGTPMPESGVSAFVVSIQRRDMDAGASLGSGHFAGVAVMAFPHMAPNFAEMKNMGSAVWAVQDVQDCDSMPGQEPIPPLMPVDGRVNELFRCGTRLLFILDRSTGTLSLARDRESPRIIFHDLPRDVQLCPFVRLDNTNSSATLSRFSHSKQLSSCGRSFYQPSMERTALAQPVTASFLRRFPFSIVLKLFPAMMQVVSMLPAPKAARLEQHWSDVSVYSRFQYRLAKALDTMVEMGVFGRTMIECTPERVNALFTDTNISDVISSLSVLPEGQLVALPLAAAPHDEEHPAGTSVAKPTAAERLRGVTAPVTPLAASLAPSPSDDGGAPLNLQHQGGGSYGQHHRRALSLFSGITGAGGGGSKLSSANTTAEAGAAKLASSGSEACLERGLASSKGGSGMDRAAPTLAYFRLPSEYEVVGWVAGTSMLRLIHVDARDGPTERTLHAVNLNSPSCCVHSLNEVLPHPSAMRQCEILPPLNNVLACGIVTEGWFDCTLADLWAGRVRDHVGAEEEEGISTGQLPPAEERKIATSLLCAVEHWHLHGFPHGHISPTNIYLRVMKGIVSGCAVWINHPLPRSSVFASPRLRSEGIRDANGDLWSCAAIIRRLRTTKFGENASLLACAALLESPGIDISQVLHDHEVLGGPITDENSGEGPTITLRTGSRLRGGSGSYNGIMFDVIAKNTTVRITKLGFVPDTNASATVTLYARKGSFLGAENTREAWREVLSTEILLSDNQETSLDGFEPLTVPAGSRLGLFLHTTNGSGVLFYSENEGVLAGMGQVEEENNDIGISIGKKSESSQPFMNIQNQKRLLKGSITYTLITRSNGPRSSLIFSHDAQGPDPSLKVLDSDGKSCDGPPPHTDLHIAAESFQPVLLRDGSRPAGTLVPALKLAKLSTPTMSLITRDEGRLEWLPASNLIAARYPSYATDASPIAAADDSATEPGQRLSDGTDDGKAEEGGNCQADVVVIDEAMEDHLRTLERSITTALRSDYYGRTVRSRLLGDAWPVVRRATFVPADREISSLWNGRASSCATDTTGGSEGRKAPRETKTTPTFMDWVSQPIEQQCVMSLWAAPHSQLELHLVFNQCPSSQGEAPSPLSIGSNVVPLCTDVRGCCFVSFDVQRQCIQSSTGGLVPWRHTAASLVASSGTMEVAEAVRLCVREPMTGRTRRSAATVGNESAPPSPPPYPSTAVKSEPLSFQAYVASYDAATHLPFPSSGTVTEAVSPPGLLPAKKEEADNLHSWSALSVAEGLSVLRAATGASTTIATGTTAEVGKEGALPGEQRAFKIKSFFGDAVNTRVFPIGGEHGRADVLCAEMPLRARDTTISIPLDDAPAALITTSRTGRWLNVLEELLFTSHSPSIDVGMTTIHQVLYSPPCKCLVLSPSFTHSDVHEVLLHVSFPRGKALKLFLEPAASPSDAVELPISVCETLGDELFGSPQLQEAYLRLYVDVANRSAYVVSNTGTFVDALHTRPTAFSSSTEVRLTVHPIAPGSSVRFLSWRRRSATSEYGLSATTVDALSSNVGPAYLSSNVPPTVGIITRHSSRAVPGRAGGGGGADPFCSSPLTADERSGAVNGRMGGRGADGRRPGNQMKSAEKQMKMLIVSYARLLLEKALVAQDSARDAVRGQLHTLLSYTSLRISPAMAALLDSEFRRGSYRLLAEACAQLLAPAVLQTAAGVETGVNVVTNAMASERVRRAMSSPVGPSLTIALLRAATIYTRTTRHTALKCAQELLSDTSIPLPAHGILTAHLTPLLRMMSSLCRQGKPSSPVVQIGVTLVANLIARYQVSRPGVSAPGTNTAIPYPVVVCARAVIIAITEHPPRALPVALTKEQISTHRILSQIIAEATSGVGQSMAPARATFSEMNRDRASVKTFEVLLGGPRKGAVVVGWDMHHHRQTAENTNGDANSDSDVVHPLPSCGYYIEPTVGKVFVCIGRKKEEQPLKVKARPGDVVVVTCSYKDQAVHVALRRGTNKELWTSFKTTSEESLSMPFYSAEHKADAEPNFRELASGTTNINVVEMYAELQRNPDGRDSLAPQSYDFYTELNLFAQNVLGNERSLRAETGTVGAHEIAGYAHLSSFLAAGALEDDVPLLPLVPYLKRLQLFDALTSSFSPLINLKRKSELFDIFRVLKNLCSKETEEKIQADVMRPFQNRPGKKAHVTIHTMQAQPSATLGPYPTLARSIFGQLYLQLQRCPVDTFFVTPIFSVKLAGFGSTDAGGPYRDVLSQLATEIMTTHPGNQFQLNPLFAQCGRGSASAIMPNPDLISSPQTPLMLEFFGKLLASFFITTDLLAVEFPPLFWKLLLGEKATIKDLAALDPDIVRELSAEELMERTEEELEERFPGIGNVWRAVVEENPHLGSDGQTLPPRTPAAAVILSERIADGEINRFSEAVESIQQGFDSVIPLYTLQAFRWQKVELLICGTQKLSFDAFKAECDIQLPANEASTFLSVLQSMTDEDRTLLLRFTTGQSRLPLKSRIKVQHNGAKNSLPTSSTCFYTLRLPSYASEELMKERLLYAVRQCKAIDADGQARENLILDV